MKLISMICKKLQKGKVAAQIAEELDEELNLVQNICDVAKKCAPEYDADEVYRLYKSAQAK